MSNFWDYIKEEIGKISNQSLAYQIMLAIFTPIIFIIILIFVFISNWETNTKPIKKFFNKNTIMVASTTTKIDLNAVRIDWNIPYVNPATVYNQGEEKLTSFHEYGDNYFSVYYQDHLIGKLVHHKKSDISGHDYQFTISDSSNCLKVSINIEGNFDSIRWEKRSGCIYHK